jgi:gluconate:H+ symporter, GntP family
MSGVPLAQALLLLACLIVLIALTRGRRVPTFLAIVVVASVFGLVADFSTAFVGKAFGAGFAQAIASPGLVVVAAGFVAALADATGASARLAAKLASRRDAGATRLPALCGLIAGLAAAPSSAFALLMPLLRAVAGGMAPGKRGAAPAALALAVSASHGLALVSPVPIAAAAILAAPWSRVALFGVPLAVLLAGLGAVWSRWLAVPSCRPADAMPEAPTPDKPEAAKASAWPAAVLVLATVVPLALLIVQSLGDIPSEPLGGGTARELVIGLGRPLVLLLVGIGIMAIGNPRIAGKCFADDVWSARVLGHVAGPLLAVGAAGGLQRLCQETGMAELLGERMSAWHLAGAGGLFVLFLVAATVKTLQGSSLVAAITAAGIAQPLLIPFGLDAANARALAALAVGAGAMTASHVNDDFFWLFSLASGIRPLRALAVLTAGTLLQGLAAVAVLMAIAAMIASGQ